MKLIFVKLLLSPKDQSLFTYFAQV